MQTIKSVLEQTYSEWEYLIIDGGSEDYTLNILKSLSEDARVKIFSEHDFGIYNAMNRGIARASGDYVVFLNAGDTFFDCEVLKKAVKYMQADTEAIYYGKALTIRKNGGENLIDFRSTSGNIKEELLKGNMPCHQAILATRSSLTNHYFREKYKLRADFEWLVYTVCCGSRCIGLPMIISKFDGSGVSSQVKSRLAMERETNDIIQEYAKDFKETDAELNIDKFVEWRMLSYKYQGMFMMTTNWLELRERGINISSYLLRKKWRRIAIYGMGNLGKCLLKELEGTGIDVVYCIDKKPQRDFAGKRIISISDNMEMVDAVVVTAVFSFLQIRDELKKKGNWSIISLEDIISELMSEQMV